MWTRSGGHGISREGGATRANCETCPQHASLAPGNSSRHLDLPVRSRQATAHTAHNRTGWRAKGGLGLGLAIVHRLVELHQGSVRVASEGAGRGSIFTVVLPAAAVAAADPADHGRRV